MPVFVAADSDAAAADGEVPEAFWMQLRQVRATASPPGRSQRFWPLASTSVAPSMMDLAVARGLDAMNDLELVALAERDKQGMQGLAEHHAEWTASEELWSETLEEQ